MALHAGQGVREPNNIRALWKRPRSRYRSHPVSLDHLDVGIVMIAINFCKRPTSEIKQQSSSHGSIDRALGLASNMEGEKQTSRAQLTQMSRVPGRSTCRRTVESYVARLRGVICVVPVCCTNSHVNMTHLPKSLEIKIEIKVGKYVGALRQFKRHFVDPTFRNISSGRGVRSVANVVVGVNTIVRTGRRRRRSEWIHKCC